MTTTGSTPSAPSTPRLVFTDVVLAETDGRQDWRRFCGVAYVLFAPADHEGSVGPVSADLQQPAHFMVSPSQLWAAAALSRGGSLMQVHPRQVDLTDMTVGGEPLYLPLYREYEKLRQEVEADLCSGLSQFALSVNLSRVPAAVPIQGLLAKEFTTPGSLSAVQMLFSHLGPAEPALMVHDAKKQNMSEFLYIIARERIQGALRAENLADEWIDRYPPSVASYLFGETIDLAEHA